MPWMLPYLLVQRLSQQCSICRVFCRVPGFDALASAGEHLDLGVVHALRIGIDSETAGLPDTAQREIGVTLLSGN